ncbi:hypothetical protein CFN78_03750 [Amycolatopsis antarctica]|uniref:Uncharacterized protein n=1 Tax=Amycolatopsis antarctica TaxID=1854586 RepID=A0A263D7V2_9PSEU|nr:hypothetical protein [Amycolatopsis antarctica]OZM74269.1 hypothetical protein CFN78_03750 [Amycolatopsis antarctica]
MSEARSNSQIGTGRARRWTMRGAAVTAVAVPLALMMSGSASAAEITPIAEYLDETIASTSASVVEALSALLGV